MKRPAAIRSIVTALAAGLLGAQLPAAAHELGSGARPAGFTIVGAEETLRDHCARDAEGRLWFALPGGPRFELVTSTCDPAVANPGDGAFHPFDVAEVRAALAAVRYPTEGIRAQVFVLPYPRRSGLESAAGPGLILLSPGTRPIAREHQHAVFVHELGHVVQYQVLPDGDAEGWNTYRRLRGLDSDAYRAGGAHADRPHEIFAEDFRALFGGALARYSGTIENASIVHPEQVPGLADFLLALADADPRALAFEAWPNPSRGAVRFSRPGAATATLDVFDAAGRRVATLEPLAAGSVTTWAWDGRGADGRPVAPGVLFARLREAGARATRIVVAR